jgi:hypothetical protein
MLDLNVNPFALLYVRAAVLDEKNALYENIGELNLLLKGQDSSASARCTKRSSMNS